MPFTPKMQGDFDCLCGVYSIINAIGYVKNLHQAKCDSLFRYVFGLASDVRPSAMITGLFFTDMVKILSDVDVPGIKVTMPFMSQRFDSVQDYYDRLAMRINGKQACAIIGMGEPHNHWTCVDYVYPRTLSLMDSAGRRHIKMAQAAFEETKGAVRLHTRQTVFIEDVN